MDALIQGLLKTGAPWGFLCAVLLFAVYTLWQHLNVCLDRLYLLSTQQVEVNIVTKESIVKIEKNIDEISRNTNKHHE